MLVYGVQIWNAARGYEMAQMKGHTETVWSVAFSPNGACIVSGSFDETVRIWNAATGHQMTQMMGHF
jgi:WD40 repeat protein